MRYFSIQVGLLQVSLQDANAFVPTQLSQGEDVHTISEPGRSKSPPKVMQGRHLSTGFLGSARYSTSQSIITQTLRTTAWMRYPQGGAIIPTGRVRDTGGVDVDNVSEAGAGASHNLAKNSTNQIPFMDEK
jgi:hypothetical protein